MIRKFYDMLTDGSIGAYKDQDGDWIEYFKKPNQSIMKLEDYPHLVEMKYNIQMIDRNSKEYWHKRCIMLEKCLDETYSKFERDNCYMFYKMLVNK